MAEKETITFEFIRQIQRDEKNFPKLTKLPEDFYRAASEYLEKKRGMIRETKDEIEVRNIERMVEDIFNRRERKLINFALVAVRTGVPPENLSEEEKEFFEKIVSLLKERRRRILRPVLEGKIEETEERGMVEIIFKEDVEEFLGVDEKTYGPFKKGEKALIPKENAEIFIKRGIALKA